MSSPVEETNEEEDAKDVGEVNDVDSETRDDGSTLVSVKEGEEPENTNTLAPLVLLI